MDRAWSKPTSTSPEDEPGLSISIVDPDFPEQTVHLISQFELIGLVTDIDLSKTDTELLASSLQVLNLLQHCVYKESYSRISIPCRHFC